MTTARSSRRSKGAAAGLTLLLLAAATAPASAHRRDEYLQAARIAIDPDRVQVTLDLTPGISVAQSILAGIDRDGSGSISAQETESYARELLRGVALDVDGMPVGLDLAASTFPALDAVRNGEGTMRVEAVAQLSRLAAGVHHLHYRNSHRADIGVYLANALVPASDRVAVTAQRRDRDQRDLMIDYVLQADTSRRTEVQVFAGAAVAMMSLAAWWRRRHVEYV
jgi:hypothetical protein